ncbi:MAG TPA: serine/threonine-protein kinase [Polyangium sp.]|nr:serine/threonine-protein kinase [Polyangium sp.]
MVATPEPGTILLDKYRVERVLGRGGMGFVVGVRHVVLGELFAIKMLRPDLQDRTDANERFLREARALARLRGEHVVRVQDVGSFEDGSSYMLMEHLQGRDLQRELDQRGPLPFEEAALYLLQASEAVAEAHEQGIIHRDLKPANLFLTTRPNGTPCVKVLDFGISKEMNTLNADLTRTGAFIGSPGYVSPERLANNRIAHAQSDIWSLGTVLYELVAGHPAFQAKLLTDLVAQVLSATPVPLSQIRPGIPAEFEAIVKRCLEKRPERRYASARELIEALEPFAAQYQRAKTARKTSAFAQDEKTEVLPQKAPIAAKTPNANTLVLEPATARVAALPAAAISESGPLERIGQTQSDWGKTRDSLIRKDQKPLVLGLAVMAVALVLVVLVVATGSTNDKNEKSEPATNPENSASPVAVAHSTIPPAMATSVAPAEVVTAAPAASAVEAQAAPETPTGAASAKASTGSTTAPKPRQPNKRPTLRGYDE